MKPDRQWIAGRGRALAVVTAALGLGALEALAATTEYQYDALARLRRVVHDNGVVTQYTLDAAGNRTRVDDLPPAVPSPPPSITVPTAVPGSYVVSWAAALGVITLYELFESTTASFASQVSVYAGTGLGTTLLRPDGTYFYRVRACGPAGCSEYTTSANAVVVSRPPPGPPQPAAPTGLVSTYIQNCVWRANWNAVSGAANYRVAATNGTEQLVTDPQAYVTCPFNNKDANKPKWVQACSSANSCSIRVFF